MLKIFRHMNINKSIKAKITLSFLILFTISLAAITLAWYTITFNNIKKNAIDYVNDSISRINQSLSVVLNDMVRISSIISIDEYNVINFLKSSSEPPDYEWFIDFIKVKNLINSYKLYKETIISGIAIIDQFGQTCKTGTLLNENRLFDSELSEEIYLARGDTKILFRQSDALDPADEKNVITIGKAIFQNGKQLGFMVIDIEYDQIRKLLELRYPQYSYLFLLNSSGDFMFNLQKEDDLESGDSIISQIQLDSLNYGMPAEKTINGQKHIILKKSLEFPDWTIVGLFPTQPLINDLMRQINLLLLIVSAIYLLIIASSLFISQRITGNIKSLRETVKKVEMGDLNALPQVTAQDEIGDLSKGFLSMMVRIKALLSDVKIKEEQKRKAELEALQAQINPHFIYNSLNTIKYLSDLQNTKNISEVVDSLIDILRATTQNNNRLVTIEEELDHVKSYIRLQKYKYLDHIKVSFQVEDEILNYKTLKFILQPIVENSYIHGFNSIERECVIIVKAYRMDNRIIFSVTDNGVGMSEKQVHELANGEKVISKSKLNAVGIDNIKERLNLFFGEKAGFIVDSKKNMYTNVEISIPVIQ